MNGSPADSNLPTEPVNQPGDTNAPPKESSIHSKSSSSKSRVIATGAAVGLLLALYTTQYTLASYFNASMQLLLAAAGAEYSDLGILQFVTLPFSLKILFAPFLDLYYFEKFGKRKTYIVPLLMLIAGATFCVSFFMNDWITNYSTSLIKIVTAGFTLQLFNAVQDIANDGWVVSLLNQDDLAKGASSQGAGSTLGSLFGYYFFIPLSSVSFCNKYIFSTEHTEPLLTSQSFLMIFAGCALALALIILLFVRERSHNSKEYKHLSDIPRLCKGVFENKNLRLFNLLLLTFPFCLSVITQATDVNLVRKGMSTSDISNYELLSLPLVLLICWIIPKHLNRHSPNIKFLLMAITGQLIAGAGLFFIFESFDSEVNYTRTWYFLVVVRNLYSGANMVQYIMLRNFIQKISNPEIAAALITTENVFNNLGTWIWNITALFFLQHINLYVLVGCSWIGGVIYLLTFGRYAARSLDATPRTEFYPRIAKENIPYQDIPDNLRSE